MFLILNMLVLGFTTIMSILSVVALIFIYIDAKQKNEKALLWLLLSLFLGYIPILVYVFKFRKKFFENINSNYFKFLKIFSILYIVYLALCIVYYFYALSFTNTISQEIEAFHILNNFNIC